MVIRRKTGIIRHGNLIDCHRGINGKIEIGRPFVPRFIGCRDRYRIVPIGQFRSLEYPLAVGIFGDVIVDTVQGDDN